MSFNICRGTLGSLAMFTAIRNASSRVRSFALAGRMLAPRLNHAKVSKSVDARGYGLA
jgi:hypothetical protein